MVTEISYAHKDSIVVSDSKIHTALTSIDDSPMPVKWFPILFDTGAFITLISKNRAQTNGYGVVAEKACTISGFSEKGLLCDLRKIPTAVFCGFRIDDILIATPHDDGVEIAEVLGMNVIENFEFGLNLSKEEIYLSVRHGLVSQKPKYQCGKVSLLSEVMEF